MYCNGGLEGSILTQLRQLFKVGGGTPWAMTMAQNYTLRSDLLAPSATFYLHHIFVLSKMGGAGKYT